MKLATLYSGGKDSTYATYLAEQQGHEVVCLITIISENQDSYMYHTPSITKTTTQAERMNKPLIIKKTKGKKEEELQELQEAITEAKEKYHIEGIITGAVESIYQTTRIQTITNKLKIECFNPLWQKDQKELLQELLQQQFDTIIISTAAYPLNKTWLGRTINKEFITEITKLQQQFGINIAGEGGEYETYVTNCPLYNKPIVITKHQDSGKENTWRRELETQ